MITMLISIYEIVESLKAVQSKGIFNKIYIWIHRRKLLKKMKTMRFKLDKDFFLDLIQFGDLTNIFKTYSGERVTIIELSDNLIITLSYRNNIINVLYRKDVTAQKTLSINNNLPISYIVRITKDFNGVISKDTTDYYDENVDIIIDSIYNIINTVLTSYIKGDINNE